MVITFITEQGGIGKTTLCYNLGWHLAKCGKKVLLIDLDSQRANMSFIAGVKNKEEEFGIYDIITNNKYTIPNSKIEIFPNLSIIAGNQRTPSIEAEVKKQGVDVLKKILNKEKKNYDYIFIDTSPSPNATHIASMVASEYIIIPTGIDGKSAEATLGVIDTFEETKEEFNKGLSVLAIVVNKFIKQKTLVKDTCSPIIDTICRVKGVNMAQTIIPHNTNIDQVSLTKEGVTSYSPGSVGAKAIKKLSKELFNI